MGPDPEPTHRRLYTHEISTVPRLFFLVVRSSLLRLFLFSSPAQWEDGEAQSSGDQLPRREVGTKSGQPASQPGAHTSEGREGWRLRLARLGRRPRSPAPFPLAAGRLPLRPSSQRVLRTLLARRFSPLPRSCWSLTTMRTWKCSARYREWGARSLLRPESLAALAYPVGKGARASAGRTPAGRHLLSPPVNWKGAVLIAP